MEQNVNGEGRGKNFEYGGGSSEPQYHVLPRIQFMKTRGMRTMSTNQAIYKWGWNRSLDELYIHTLYSVAKEVDVSTRLGVAEALSRVHFMLCCSRPELGITITDVMDQYRNLCRRYVAFKEYVRLPGVTFDPNTNCVSVSNKLELLKNGVEDDLWKKFFRNNGLPLYNLMEFIFGERDARRPKSF